MWVVFLQAVVAMPWLLVAMPFIAIGYFRVQQLFRSSSRELLRMDGTTKSPIFAGFGEALSGRCAIRAFGSEDMFIGRMRGLTDHHFKLVLAARLLERWSSFFLNLLASTITLALCLTTVLLRDEIDVALVGIALVYCLQLMGLTSWTMMTFVQLESHATSCERLLQILKIPSEKKAQPGCHAPATWPSKGEIVFKNANLRYREGLNLAIKDLNLHIKAGEKLGVAGRTGAGKSSLMAMLLRLFEPEPGSVVLVDGVDVLGLPLNELRRGVAIIPQDPVLFSGTVRQNIDPEDRYSDTELWHALDVVMLRDVITNFPAGLDQELLGAEEIDLSHGQRQLICIARAVLKSCKILLCDEATSSIDDATDKIIQKVIHEHFKTCTVITIAHRIDSITNADRVRVPIPAHFRVCLPWIPRSQHPALPCPACLFAGGTPHPYVLSPV